MIIQTLRIPGETVEEIAQVAKEIGESKQTVIRLSIKEGLPLLKQRLGVYEPTITQNKDFSSENHLASNKGEK